MRTLDQYIRELLFSHNCVIIPGFGGFVADYNPSSVHPVQHTFTPPSKKIAFNKQLQNEDGLLANFIAEKENISFESARKAIEEQVYQLYLILNEKNKLFLPSIGEFFYDVEKNLQFRENKKINYLLESFGLDAVQSPPVKREGFSQSVNRQLTERQSMKPSSERLFLRRKALLKISLFAVPVIVFMIWISVFTGVLSKVGQFNYSSLIPYSCKKATEAPALTYKAIPVKKETKVLIQPVLPDTEEKVIMDVKVPESSIEDSKKTPKSVEKTEESLVPLRSLRSYFIVGGAFENKENAENMVDKLNSDGFNAEIIGKNERGLYLVSFQGFDSKKSALTQLKQIKADYDSLAWLYRSAN